MRILSEQKLSGDPKLPVELSNQTRDQNKCRGDWISGRFPFILGVFYASLGFYGRNEFIGVETRKPPKYSTPMHVLTNRVIYSVPRSAQPHIPSGINYFSLISDVQCGFSHLCHKITASETID